MATHQILKLSFLLWIALASSVSATWRIMPMGDSITFGDLLDNTTRGGYRNYLENMLQIDGVSFDFVGSLSHGDAMNDPQHEGYRGHTMTELTDEIVTRSIVSQGAPHVVLLKIGTNDVVYGGNGNTADLQAKLEILLNAIEAQASRATIIVSAICPVASGFSGDNQSTTQRIVAFNNLLEAEVLSRKASGKRYDYVPADQWLESYFLFDGVHPNEQGYVYLANQWKPALDRFFNLRANLSYGDMDGNGSPDLFWRNSSTSTMGISTLVGGSEASYNPVGFSVNDPNWKAVSHSDFNLDGYADVLFRHSLSGKTVIFFLKNGTKLSGAATNFVVPDTNWEIAETGDLNGDNYPDIFWRHRLSSKMVVFFMRGATKIGSQVPSFSVADANWKSHTTGDFNQDGNKDILWRHRTSGRLVIFYLDGLTKLSSAAMPFIVPDGNWQISQVSPLFGFGGSTDQYPDIFWHHSISKAVVVFDMQNLTRKQVISLPTTLSGVSSVVF